MQRLSIYYDSSDLLHISILQLQRITTLECGKEKRNHLLSSGYTRRLSFFIIIIEIIHWLHWEQRGLDSGLSLISLLAPRHFLHGWAISFG